MAETRLTQELFNEKRLRILQVLLDNPDSQYTVTEIVEQSGVSKPTVIDFVDLLSRVGIVEKQRKGNAYLISLNEENDYIPHLRSILKLDAEPLREAAAELAESIVEEAEAVVSVVLYGSVARGAPTVDSDIDVLVIVDDSSVRSTVEGVVKTFQEEKGLRFSPLVMELDEVEERAESGDSFVRRVVEDGNVLYGEEPWSRIAGKTR
ncbi:MAG: nucleotidyltransferase domain-containing protein [Candidatus Nanohaloarchaea archaeon]|nr:nucleotidyltransferase domain-containing protein [Candidatus Nanohaloarchaea archaeon]